jgi:hypothetical protein
VESSQLNDIINVVAGSAVREDPFRIRANKQGIDFVHDGSNHVRIGLRHQRYQRSHESLAGCPSTILSWATQRKRLLGPGVESSSDKDTDDEVEQQVAAVVIGREFEALNRVYKVQTTDLDRTKVNAKLVWPLTPLLAPIIIQFDFVDAARWIKSRMDEDE